MTVAIIIFFIGAFLALGILAAAILILRRLVKNKQSEQKKFNNAAPYSGIQDSDNSYHSYRFSADDDDHGSIYLAAENEEEPASDGAAEASAIHSEAMEGSARKPDHSVADSYEPASNYDSSYDSSSSSSDSSTSEASGSDSGGSSSSWD